MTIGLDFGLSFFTHPGGNCSQLYLNDSVYYRVIPNLHTAHRLGYHNSSSEVAFDNDAFQRIKNGTPVPSLIPNYKIMDDIMRVELLRINLIQNPTVITWSKKMGSFQNPAIVRDRNRTFWSHRGQRWRDTNNYFDWLNYNASDLTQNPDCTLGDIGNRYGALNLAEDIRMIVNPNGSISLIYTQITTYTRKKLMGHMAMSRLMLSQQNKYEFLDTWRLHWEMRANIPVEKNWSPFLYESQIYFVYSLQPLEILQVANYNSSNRVANMSVVSALNCHSHWEYGHMRGGTPFLLVGDVYLSFFHSRVVLKGGKMTTYFMGAVTMSTDLPFRLLHISKVPIIIDEFYLDAWCGCPPFNYVIFPMGYFTSVDSNNATTINLSLGRNDQEGWMVRIPLQPLLDSLVPVKCVA